MNVLYTSPARNARFTQWSLSALRAPCSQVHHQEPGFAGAIAEWIEQTAAALCKHTALMHEFESLGLSVGQPSQASSSLIGDRWEPLALALGEISRAEIRQ